jgi:Nif-specific regulatory protein
MEGIYQFIDRVAGSDAPVLLVGERGTKKPVVARAIHEAGARSGNPFVTVSWAEVTETYVETELFGAGQTLASMMLASKKGRFEEAIGGTAFLEEVSDFSTATQAKLLRFLRDGAFQRLGTQTVVEADVRIIAATCADLRHLVEAGRFLSDLLDELDVVSIRIPPLRERKSDIVHLAQHYLHRYARTEQKSIRRISLNAISQLVTYGWPGNLVELEHCMQRAALLCDGDAVDVEHLPPTVQSAAVDTTADSDNLQETLDHVEKALIIDALRLTNGNQSKAAALLGVTERLMGLRVKKHGLDPRAFRTNP